MCNQQLLFVMLICGNKSYFIITEVFKSLAKVFSKIVDHKNVGEVIKNLFKFCKYQIEENWKI